MAYLRSLVSSYEFKYSVRYGLLYMVILGIVENFRLGFSEL